ncbi:TPA: hypothetical protein P1K40_000051 [Clostridioides difficile]|nr:hypothetical protein [Clostridioides difficile]
MAEKFNFETFFEAYSGEFAEYLSRASTGIYSEAEYQNLTGENDELYRLYPKVLQVLDMDMPCGLTEQECTALVQVLTNKNKLIELEEKQVYFKGCIDCVGYLKKMNLL